MSHMVIYRGSDGKPGYHQTDDIHDAVGFVEQMRNEQGVEHARIFRLEEVVFQYKPYYRVELAEAGSAVGEIQEAADAADSNGSVSTNGAEMGADNGGETNNGSSSDGDGSSNSETVNSDESGDDTADAGAKKGLFGR